MIHPQAIIDPKAQLADDVSVGPFTTIGPNVRIESGTSIGPHNVIKGPTRIGKNNKIFQFCSIGEDTPDLKYANEPTELKIGDNNTIREFVSIHRGTVQDRSLTTVGCHNLFMPYTHVGHDSIVGSHCIMSNSSAIAGHVHMGDWAIISAMSAVHQYGSIGTHAFVGAYTAVYQDVPAFVIAHGTPAKPRAINTEGLKRRDFSVADIKAIQKAFKTLYKRKLPLAEALVEIKEQAAYSPVILPFYDSVANARRNIIR